MLSFAAAGHDDQYHWTNHHVNTEVLIARIGRNDDVRALIELYEATERAVYAYILSITLNPGITIDLVQETYLCLRRSAHLYVHTGKPLAWILSIANKLTRDYIRVHKHIPAQMEEVPSFDCVTEITDRIILSRALGNLRSKERQVLFLHAAAKLRHREIAAYLSIPISEVQVHYKRSVDKLRKRLYELGVSV